MTAAPGHRHQRVVATLVARLFVYAEERGGEVLPAPFDVAFSDMDVVEPDIVFVSASNVPRIEERYLRSAPDLAVEVSSPSTRSLELTRKKDLYERYGVPEYWYVDLEADRVEIYRLEEGGYQNPVVLGRGEILGSPLLAGLSIPVDDVLGIPHS